eukprot:GSChrysophyteH1.ASY1.ANO1.1435.1 assembled CDS
MRASSPPPTPTLYKRKDFLGVDQEAQAHPNRTYYFRKNVDLTEVIETCGSRLRTHPDDIKALFLRGTAFFKRQEYEASIEDLNRVIELDSSHLEAYYHRGMACTKLDSQEEAIQDLTKVLEMNSNHVNAAFARAACYNSIGQFSRAIEDYNFALLKDESNKLDPSNNPTASSPTEKPGAVSPGVGKGTEGRDSPTVLRLANPGVESSEPPPMRAVPSLPTFLKTEAAPAGVIGNETSALDSYTVPPAPISSLSGQDEDSRHLKDIRSISTSESESQHAQQAYDSAGLPQPVLGPNRFAGQDSKQTEADMEDSSTLAEYYHTSGYQLRRAGDFSGAISYYSRAINIDPTHFKAYFNRGFAKDKLGHYKDAVEDYTEAIHLEPNNAFAFYNRGISFDRQGLYEKALDDFSTAISLIPNNADFFHNRAFCLRKLNKLKEAIDDYGHCLSLQPNHFKALHNRAYCLERLHDLEGSVTDYTRALELEPRHVASLSARAVIYERLEVHDLALQDYEVARRYNIENMERMNGKSSSYSPTASANDARDEHALDLDSALSPSAILCARGINYKMVEQYKRAIEDFTAALNMERTGFLYPISTLYNHRGFCYRKMEKYTESISDYSNAIKFSTPQDSIRALNNRGFCYARIGKFKDAVADYTKVIDLDPYNSHAYHNRGISLDKLGNFDAAIADFTTVLNIDSNNNSVDPNTHALAEKDRYELEQLKKKQDQAEQHHYAAGPGPSYLVNDDKNGAYMNIPDTVPSPRKTYTVGGPHSSHLERMGVTYGDNAIPSRPAVKIDASAFITSLKPSGSLAMGQ